MLGLHHGMQGARRWRQIWSDHRLKADTPESVHALAKRAVEPTQP
jgi:tRNA-dihydrouridine synthase A